jgi:hypothetical protein
MNKRILSQEQKEKNRIRARKYYNEHKEKCNAYEKQRRLKIKNDPILNQQMKYYKREWTRNKRKKDKENAELVIKYKIVIDKIKEYIKENANANVDYILELLEETE